MRTLSKFEIAEAQLFQAIRLYLEGQDLVSPITLAGAADEILGEIARAAGTTSALDDKVTRLCDLHVLLHGEQAARREYLELRNKARNAFKHLQDGNAAMADLEMEAASLIGRGIANYRKIKPGYIAEFRAFEREMLKRNYRG